MNQQDHASASMSEANGNVSMARRVSTSIALAFTLLYVTYQGAWSSDQDDARIEALIAELSAGHPTQRLDAQEALEKIGKPAVPALSQALASEDSEVRFGAAETLRQIGPDADAAIPALITALEDEMIGLSVAKALEKIGSASVPHLVEALVTPDPAIRSRVTLIIGSIAEDGGEAGMAVPALIANMREPDSAGEPDWPHDKQADALMALTNKRSPDIASGMKTMEQANEMIKNGSADERDALLAELDKARQQMMQGLPTFKEAIDASGPRESSRPNIAIALGDIGPPAVPALLELLSDADTDLRKMSTIAFTEMGKEVNDDFDEPMDIGDEVEPVVAGLTHALADAEADVQAGAVRALVAFGDLSVPSLIVTLDDAEMIRRANAAKALGKIKPPAEDAIPALTDALDDDHADVRLDVVQALATMGPVASSAAPRLGELLVNDEDAKVRRAAAKSLRLYGDETTIPMLVEATGDDDRYVRRSAAQSLYSFGEASVPALIQALGHEKEAVRTHAERVIMASLAEGPHPVIVEALEDALDDDRDAVRTRARELLNRIDQR